MANEDSALAGGHSSGLAPFGIGFHFDENNAVEVRKETSGDHTFLMLCPPIKYFSKRPEFK